jgi:hypothetical protein
LKSLLSISTTSPGQLVSIIDTLLQGIIEEITPREDIIITIVIVLLARDHQKLELPTLATLQITLIIIRDAWRFPIPLGQEERPK